MAFQYYDNIANYFQTFPMINQVFTWSSLFYKLQRTLIPYFLSRENCLQSKQFLRSKTLATVDNK